MTRPRPLHVCSHALPTFVAVAVALAVWLPGHAQADEYALTNREWDGLAAMQLVADENRVELLTPDDVDLGALDPATDALLILYPTRALPASLGGYMAEGGRVAIADDFGASAEFLQTLDITRADFRQAGLRGNPQLPVATPGAAHPLTEGVRAVVSNHPVVLSHPSLDPVLRFRSGAGGASSGADTSSLVLAGGVGSGRGRLVALGDPSVLINNMMQFRGNRRFASNLLGFLVEGAEERRVIVVRGDAVLHGRVGTPNADRPMARAREALESAASADLPPSVLRVATACFVLIGLIFLASTLPRRSPYLDALARPDGESKGRTKREVASDIARGGLAGRIAHFSREDDMIHPALVYRHELFSALRERLDLHAGTDHHGLLRALRGVRGLDERTLRAADKLLPALDRIWAQVDRPPGPGRVRPAALTRMVQTGEALLAAIPEPDGSRRPS